MSDEDVLLRCVYRNGIEYRFLGRRCVWSGPAPFFLFTPAEWPWLSQSSPSLALVKEGVKALTIYHRGD